MLSKRLVGLALVGLGVSVPAHARVEPKTYLVAGFGYASVVGAASVADDRDPGWAVYGGLRRTVNPRVTLGASVDVAFVNFSALDFFDRHDVSLTNPDNYATGGDLTLLALTGEGIWNFEVDRSTVLYAKAGAGYYNATRDAIALRNTGDSGIESVIPAEDLREASASGPGGFVGGGVRFPLGENAGLWAELRVHFADLGGSMTYVPLCVGISLP